MPVPIKVLVVDDSAFMRRVIADILSQDPELSVIGVAHNGQEAVKRVEQLRPDVVTMDVEMPVLDGLAAVEQIMAKAPTPVVMLSNLTAEGAMTTIKALELGAVDFICKPAPHDNLDSVRKELITKIKVASQVNMALGRRERNRVSHGPSGGEQRAETPAADRRTEAPAPVGGRVAGQQVVAIGTSTGGPRALHEVVSQLPADLPAGVLIVQHMPPGFTHSLAERLNAISALEVREAGSGDRIRPGKVFLAPGDFHMMVNGRGEIVLNQNPPVASLRPSVDVMFKSVAEVYGAGTLAVVLTGMGSDGAKGVADIKAAGGRVIAEHQSTCVVYGMPRAVVDGGYADMVVPLPRVAEAIARALKDRNNERGGERVEAF
ncbi:MAG: chemotaxis response regulator protein-glutamate methylesterase [Firmicutes bacterium]|nr:chemotaxis response regulator protein-glutamate methylesterase [Bacillota bacterium]